MSSKKITAVLVIIIFFFAIGGIYFIKNNKSHKGGMGSLMDMVSATSTEALPVSIAMIGEEDEEFGGLSNSWSGEIISFGDIGIQPRREGTIVEWNVNIGQKVRQGQMIARLSAPPAMPELTSMLAEQAKMLTEARVDAKAQEEFAEKKKQQLADLRESLDKSRNSAVGALNNSSAAGNVSFAQEAINQAKNTVNSEQKIIYSTLEQAIKKELKMFTDNELDYVLLYKTTAFPPRINIMASFGKVSENTRSVYAIAAANVLKEIVKENINVESVGTEYFKAAVKMIGSTYSDEQISTSQIADISKMVAMDQMAFLDAIKDYQMSRAELAKMEIDYKLMLAEKETDFAMQKSEIEEQIAMLEKDVAMSNGKVEAAKVAYGTVAGSINGGLAIVSPANGVISSIMKKNGDFVEPGMAIASLNTGRKEDRFVRFRIPSNIRLPEPGTELTIVRPGFSKDVKKVKLIGVGTALDGNGSYQADAKFMDLVDWPVNISVRVMPDDHSSSSMFVNLGALEWDDKGASVWLIGSDNMIKKQAVKTGRNLGEKVEVYEGLMLGDRYVAKLVSGLQEGIEVKEGEAAGMAKITEGDAHGDDVGGGHGE